MMTIGQVIDALERAPDKSASVYFDFAHTVPTGVASWRGIYAEPALGWADAGRRGSASAPTVAELLAELRSAISGKEFSGWKGGDFTYTSSNTLHVDNPGDCSNTEIVGFDTGESRVVIRTAMEES